jgi:hypothetical protein
MMSSWNFRGFMAMLSKTELKENLSKSIAKVVFNKSDGSTRIMNCTLMANYLPMIIKEEQVAHVPRKQNDEVLAVWDLDNQGWRSFNINSVIEVQYIGEDNAAST